MKKYVIQNQETISLSAQNARSFLNKTSKLHLGYKETMVEMGIKGFITEYTCGPYSIDEADPLAKIALEVDGCERCGLMGDTRIQTIDKKKSTFLKNRGWAIIHVKEHEIKKDPKACIEMVRNLQARRRELNKDKIRASFLKGQLRVKSMVNKGDTPVWSPLSDILQHSTPHKRMLKIATDASDVKVTEDHSLFEWPSKEPVSSDSLKKGDSIVGAIDGSFGPLEVSDIEEIERHEKTYDVSVPLAENAVLDSGILVHNTYSISGVSLDIEKSSKYQSMKDEYIGEYDKLVEAAKRSIKIIKGLKQFRYGIGITSALGPLNRPGVQSRSNWISPFRGSYA